MLKDNKGTYFILVSLLIVASVLRLYHPFQIPFNGDELGALSRTKFSTFSKLISKGIIIDAHPAGVQVFLYYWTKIVGYSELAVKLPFIICGILSVFYVFLLGREWFNSTVGLVCAAFVATLEYPITYSQLARPYASGLLFSLAMIWYWNKVVFSEERPKSEYYKNLFLYVLFSALCAYNHHFSLLLAAIVGFTGLFFVRGKYLLKYILAGICIFVLYIPHLSIFFYQLKIGGIGNWLGKPQNEYLIQYFSYVFQFSVLAYLIVGLLFLVGLITAIRKKYIPTPYYLISIAWFLLPFLIGFFYSRFVNPVMEYSGLIFSFPFMLYGLFGLLPDLKIKPQVILIMAICAVNIYVLAKERRYYDVYYQYTNERQAIINDSVYKKIGKNDVIAIAESPSDSVTLYYSRKYHTNIPYVQMPGPDNKQQLIKYLEVHKTHYLTYDNIYDSNFLYLPIILNYYPYVVLQNNLAGGTNYIFSSVPEYGKSPYLFQSINDFEKPCKYWGKSDASLLSNTVLIYRNHSYEMDSLHEWAPSFSCDLDTMTTNRNVIILVSVTLYPLESLKDVLIVTSLKANDKEISWSATPVSEFIPDSAKCSWMKAYHAINLLSNYINYPGIKVQVYIWNKGRKNFYMDDFSVRTIYGNPYLYGLIEKI